MSIKLTTFLTNEDVTPTEDALVYEYATTSDGILYGCNVAKKTNNTIFVGSGHGVLRGRKFTVLAEILTVPLISSGTKQKKLVVKMDLGNVSNPISFSIKDKASSLIQQKNINIINGVYEYEIATFDVSATSISNLKQTFKLLDRDWLDKAKADKTVAQMFKLTKDSGEVQDLLEKEPLNSVKETGFYYVYNSKDTPSGETLGLLIVFKRNGFVTFQTFQSWATKKIYTRVATGETSWSNWEQLATATDLSKKADKTYVDNADNLIKTDISNLKKLKADKSVAQMFKLTKDDGAATYVDKADANRMLNAGFYYVNNATNTPNKVGWLMVYNALNRLWLQYFYDYFGKAVHVRASNDGGKTWKDWQQLATTENVQMYKTTLDNGGLTEVTDGDFNTIYKTGDYFMKGCKNSPPLEGSEQAYFYLSNKNLYQSSSYCWQQAVNAQTSSSWVRTLWGGKPTAWKRSSY